jgi:hypothetical protein
VWQTFKDILLAIAAVFLGKRLSDAEKRADDAESETAELRQRLQDADDLGRLSGPERDERMRAAEERVRELQSRAAKRD